MAKYVSLEEVKDIISTVRKHNLGVLKSYIYHCSDAPSVYELVETAKSEATLEEILEQIEKAETIESGDPVFPPIPVLPPEDPTNIKTIFAKD